MSVAFTLAVADGLRYNGIEVTFEPGWETRGNGQVWYDGRPEGLIEHHTAASFDGGLSILIHGRSDLPGPLCNSCGFSSGRVHIIAAFPANHAGASGGRSMGPLPTTNLFNKRVWGHEIMYPGVVPMTAAQYRSAQVLGCVISSLRARPNSEWVRAHAETSITGKWDPGYANGKTIDMAAFRRTMPDALTPAPPPPSQEDDDMAGSYPVPLPAVTADDPGKPAGAPTPFGHLEIIPVPINSGGGAAGGPGNPADVWLSLYCGWADMQVLGLHFKCDDVSKDYGEEPFVLKAGQRRWFLCPDSCHDVELRYTCPLASSAIIEWRKPA